MEGPRSEPDADPDDGRAETLNEQSDRNWADILQEVRVTQTGTQIVSGFLLTLPFQQRFHTLPPYQVTMYVVLISLAAGATAFGLAPVALHRSLFRRHEKREVVTIADRLLRISLLLVSLLTAGAVTFIVTFVVDLTVGVVLGVAILVILFGVLIMLPRGALRAAQRREVRAR